MSDAWQKRELFILQQDTLAEIYKANVKANRSYGDIHLPAAGTSNPCLDSAKVNPARRIQPGQLYGEEEILTAENIKYRHYCHKIGLFPGNEIDPVEKSVFVCEEKHYWGFVRKCETCHCYLSSMMYLFFIQIGLLCIYIRTLGTNYENASLIRIQVEIIGFAILDSAVLTVCIYYDDQYRIVLV